jgi:uncharacterized NAD(P)/FAD-binding protein YdhS
MTQENRTSIAIVGGGASGVLMAAHLLQVATADWHIHLIEQGTLGAGVAYRTTAPEHRLNVVAAKMSAYPDRPDHFLQWAQQHSPDCHPETFAPRTLYREYLQHVLHEAESQAQQARLSVIQAQVLSVRLLAGGGVRLTLNTGAHILADKVILAVGNQAPRHFYPADSADTASSDYIGSPWSGEVLTGIQADDPVLLIGAGLTAVDVLLTLQQQGHHGLVTVVSRHGYWPLPHAERDTVYQKPITELPRTALSSLRWVRTWIADALADGAQWQAAIDALRPVLNPWWAQLSHTERCRFIRHLMPLWNIARHRIPRDSDALLQRMTAVGQLRLLSGRLRTLTPNASGLSAQFETPSGPLTVDARWVVNCTGPNANLQQSELPLLRQLFAEGLIRTDALKMGLATDDAGTLIDAAGNVSDYLYTLGPLRRGQLIESVAVPEIRMQAAALSQALAQQRTQATCDDKPLLLGQSI